MAPLATETPDASADHAAPPPCSRHESVSLLGFDMQVATDKSLGVAGIVWPAQAVAARVAEQVLPEGSRVVEVGAGCGALSCAMAFRGWQVVSTDLPEVVPLLQESADLNALAPPWLRCTALVWGDDEAAQAAAASTDAVVACEVAYWGGWDLFTPDTREPLARTLRTLVGDRGVGIIVHTVRDPCREASLLKIMRRAGLELERLEPLGPGGFHVSDEALPVGTVGAWKFQRASGMSGPVIATRESGDTPPSSVSDLGGDIGNDSKSDTGSEVKA